jgi:iron complex transport system permease protein
MLAGLSAGGAIIFWKRHFLQALTLGDEVAQTLGHDPVTNTRWVLIACAVLVGVSVAVAGAVSFVGLIIPHLLRRFVGSEPRRLLLPSMIGGALLVAISDVVIRTVPYAYDFKLGVITALIGAPFFVWIVLRERNRWL